MVDAWQNARSRRMCERSNLLCDTAQLEDRSWQAMPWVETETVSEFGTEYKVIWDSRIDTLEALTTCYIDTPGFIGPASTRQGLGARIDAEMCSDAFSSNLLSRQTPGGKAKFIQSRD
eukprot:3996079-Amphidinium_carterae.1